MDKHALTVRELSQSIGISRSKVYREISAGRLKARKIGSRTVFLNKDVEDYLAALPNFQ